MTQSHRQADAANVPANGEVGVFTRKMFMAGIAELSLWPDSDGPAYSLPFVVWEAVYIAMAQVALAQMPSGRPVADSPALHAEASDEL